MASSAFTTKNQPPSDAEFRQLLGKSADLWDLLLAHTQRHGDLHLEWKHYGRKIGWLRKVLLHKRNLFFVIPGQGHFSVSFTFGETAVDDALKSGISDPLKVALRSAKDYVEGRTVVLEFRDSTALPDATAMIDIKVRS